MNPNNMYYFNGANANLGSAGINLNGIPGLNGMMMPDLNSFF
jgi:hypothetical protein